MRRARTGSMEAARRAGMMPATAAVIFFAEGKWQVFDITLIGRRVTVLQNGQTIIDNKEIPGITGGAIDSHEALPGPIILQESEKGQVSFRNIVITPADIL